MRSQGHVRHVGRGRHPVLITDEVTGSVAPVVALAARLAPFPPIRGNGYPGLRRYITPADGAAVEYVQYLLRRIAGGLNALFGFDGFDLLDASFSMVTARPETLRPEQRAPHFDSIDPAYLAVMHYVAGVEGSGTAFYRQRATGIERVDDSNSACFVATARSEAHGWDGYIAESNGSFERIGDVEAVADRLVAYQGSLLHSGVIPGTMGFSEDPREGRLTTNLFVRGRPRRA